MKERLTAHTAKGLKLKKGRKFVELLSDKELTLKALYRFAELEDELESGQLQEANNRPLTVEELKVLKADDWVWIVRPHYYEGDKGSYYKIAAVCTDGLIVWVGVQHKPFMFQDYEKEWIAYKNKQEAENE